ncbi:RNA recognition motif domain-containing protein [Phthorimaea operculella]|nr:RNA recognition motif domain-containing protein [Phthorimaea operculella]
MDNRRKREDTSEDHPIYSRLFIVCDKKLVESNFRDAFSKFGTIEDIRLPRDRTTGESKGVAYIKFSKTSEAAHAVEEMHLKTLPDTNKPIKVMVACNRADIQQDDDEHKYRRLFLSFPKSIIESELEDHFSQFGKIVSIKMQRDRNTGEPKGFAYITFNKFSEAAIAFEQCDRKYRPIFAQPKGFNRRPETAFESNLNNLANTSTGIISMMKTNHRGDAFTRVMFLCSPYLNQHLVENLFNLIPGMTGCQFFVDLQRHCGKGTVTYSNPISAAYAVEKLDRFDYPPGEKIFVKPVNSRFDSQEHTFKGVPYALNNLKQAITATGNSGGTDLAQLAQAIAEASKLIKMATGGGDMDVDGVPDSKDLNYCSVKLPPPKPLADIDAPMAKRCFLVCKPHPPPLPVLRDVFCRFGNLINVYTLPNKTVGYARYATVESANEAMRVLHGAELCGVRIKVLEAEDEAPPKRRRYE